MHMAQRNATLAEALGISREKASVAGTQEAQWEPETLHYFGDNLAWAKQIEQVLTDLLTSTRTTHMFPAMKQPQRQFVHDVAENYHLRAESLDEEPFRSVLVTKKGDSAAPRPSLTEAWAAQYRAEHAPAGKRTLASTTLTASTVPAVPPPKQELNSLYIEQCFGYDEQSLKEVLTPFLQGLYFELKWLNDEDVLCIPRLSLTSSERTLKIRLLRNAMRGRIQSCKSVEAALYDAESNAVTHREKSWSSVPATSTNATSVANRWLSGSTPSGLSNSFASLSTSDNSKHLHPRLTSRPASPASLTGSVGSSREVEVLTNGLHRPPSAVIISDARHSGPVAENWDDED
ncbi:FKBP12-associated protein [Cystobasidiomycetes sp. EMM_F5]